MEILGVGFDIHGRFIGKGLFGIFDGVYSKNIKKC